MRIRLFASLRQAAGVSELAYPPAGDARVRDVVEMLVGRYPALAGKLVDEDGGLRGAVSIFVDGRNIRLREGLDTPLAGVDELAMFPPVAGG